MTCDVSLGDWDGDTPSFYQEDERKARKAHRCEECGEDIQAGTRYVHVVGKFDGRIDAWKFCAACWEIMGEFSEGGRTFGITWDTFADEWNSGAHIQACINRVSTVAAKALLLRKWMKWKGLA